MSAPQAGPAAALPRLTDDQCLKVAALLSQVPVQQPRPTKAQK